jgi:putative Mg2+ transporter-C (MgtC) family protein
MELVWLGTDEIVVRLIAAMLLGSVLGVERLMAGKTAGMRTYALVSMGAAVFVIVSHQLAVSYLDTTSSIDPLRVVGSIVSGIGFIGAGLIIFRNEKVRGLTTAAGLWVVSGIGMSAGFGLFELALISTLLTLFVFIVLWFIKIRLTNFLQKRFPHMDDGDDDI